MNTKTSYYEKVVVNKQLSPLKEWSDIEKTMCHIFAQVFHWE